MIMKNNRGVTLIALSITIIVLLILAGISITALTGENGILAQARAAKLDTRGASIQEAKDLWRVNDEEDRVPLESFLTELEGKKTLEPGEKEKILSSTPHFIKVGSKLINFDEDGNNTNIVDYHDSVPIPKGFDYISGDKSTGLIISDNKKDNVSNSNGKNQGNQFVWVPVLNMDTFVRENYNSLEDFFNNSGEANADGVNKKVNGKILPESDFTAREAIEMYKSVKKYKGFFIGRYETSNNAGRPEVKQGKTVWHTISWGESMLNEGQNTAATIARSMYSRNDDYGIASTLCYGVQWDQTLRYIESNPLHSGFARNSSNKGNYSGDLIKTGSVPDYETNKIFDMAGNVFEWTMESYYDDYRLCRGGGYYQNGTEGSAGTRFSYTMPSSSNAIGFRIALYIK